jgi:hypothetical protein
MHSKLLSLYSLVVELDPHPYMKSCSVCVVVSNHLNFEHRYTVCNKDVGM